MWPNHFPENCPPVDAEDLNHLVYYLVENNPPVAGDFLSAMEKGTFRTKCPCQRSSLSCGLSMDYIDIIRAMPLHQSKSVSKARLTNGDGKIMRTGLTEGHHSMWLVDAVLQAAPALFEVM